LIFRNVKRKFKEEKQNETTRKIKDAVRIGTTDEGIRL
jgi:hypothetical protein